MRVPLLNRVLAGAGLLMLVALLAVLAVLERRGADPHGKVWQVHHGYALIAAGVPVLWVQVVALLIGLDDLVQHAVQLRRPYFRSPLHRLAHWLGFI